MIFRFARKTEGRTTAVYPSAIAVAVCVALLAFASPGSAADLDISLATHASAGKYGGSDTIRIVYVPLVAKLEVDAWTFRAVLPWLRVSGGSATVIGPGGPITTKYGTSSGFGDILLEGTYEVSPPFEYAPFVEIGARLKIPTASESDGLGTGEVDVTPEIELTRRYGRWAPYASAGFRVLGDTSTATYRDGFLASLGLTCRLFERFEPGVFLYWRQSASEGGSDAVELLPELRVELDEQWMVDAYGSAGFTHSTPDAGGGVQIHYRMPGAF